MTTQRKAHDFLSTIANDSSRFKPTKFRNHLGYQDLWEDMSFRGLAATSQIFLRLAFLILQHVLWPDDKKGQVVCWILFLIEVFIYRSIGKEVVCTTKLWQVEDPEGRVSYFLDTSTLPSKSARAGEILFWSFQGIFTVWLICFIVKWAQNLDWLGMIVLTVTVQVYWLFEMLIYLKKKSYESFQITTNQPEFVRENDTQEEASTFYEA